MMSVSLEMLMYFMGIKMGYSSPQTLTDQSTAIKSGDKGDLRVLRPSVMTCVPVSEIISPHLRLNSFLQTILDRIYKAVIEKVNQSGFFRRYLFRLTYKIKVKRLEYGLDTPLLNK